MDAMGGTIGLSAARVSSDSVAMERPCMAHWSADKTPLPPPNETVTIPGPLGNVARSMLLR
jgi:hypothetical protein